jgi:hypothetical protein
MIKSSIRELGLAWLGEKGATTNGVFLTRASWEMRIKNLAHHDENRFLKIYFLQFFRFTLF